MFSSTASNNSILRLWRAPLCGLAVAGLLIGLPGTGRRRRQREGGQVSQHSKTKAKKSTTKITKKSSAKTKSSASHSRQAQAKRQGAEPEPARGWPQQGSIGWRLCTGGRNCTSSHPIRRRPLRCCATGKSSPARRGGPQWKRCKKRHPNERVLGVAYLTARLACWGERSRILDFSRPKSFTSLTPSSSFAIFDSTKSVKVSKTRRFYDGGIFRSFGQSPDPPAVSAPLMVSHDAKPPRCLWIAACGYLCSSPAPRCFGAHWPGGQQIRQQPVNCWCLRRPLWCAGRLGGQ